MAEQARLFAEDAARLTSRRADFIRVPCPACDRDDSQPAFEKMGMPFVTCRSCETLFANPRPRREHLEDYYRNAQHYAYWSEKIFPASEAVRREKIFKPRVQRVLDLCRRFNLPTHTLLEVGPGFGLFGEEIMRSGAFRRVIAVEPTPNLAADCRRRGLEVVETPIEQLQRSQLLASGERIDVIASFEVIEHLFSPRDFVRQCADLLDAGGVLMVSCPNGKGFDIRMLGEKSSAVDVEHINLFNPESLTRLLDNSGFEVIDCRTPGRLDAELVRNAMLAGELDPTAHSFLRHILLDAWEETGPAFQDFLAENRLSSHMLVAARKR
jgi:2-polyprenyl-3-methyl-5-hydroxy-6-metoxy-1,4-benzoquinol methylase